jgi:predicted PurR-regulated permease PerM
LTYAATGTIGAITAGLIILFVGMFLAVDPGLYRRGLMSLVPRSRRDTVESVLEALVAALRQWLGGVLVSMLCIGVITGIGLWLLGIPLALSLALLAGVLEFIPYVGPSSRRFPPFWWRSPLPQPSDWATGSVSQTRLAGAARKPARPPGFALPSTSSRFRASL